MRKTMTVNLPGNFKKNLLFFLIPLIFVAGCGGENIEEFYAGDIPLPEHPRPDFERDEWINLNGAWMFAPDSTDVGEMHGWQTTAMDSVFTEMIQVPFSWASPFSGIYRKDFHIGWYARDILIPGGYGWKDKRIFLVIGASDFTTTVWLNEQKIGEHEGGYTQFDFDLTDYIVRGVNRLVIRTEDMPVPDRLVGKQVYGEAKGIWQTVYLEPRSEHAISRVHFSPDIDNGRVTVDVRLSKASEEDLIFSIAFMEGIVETAAETFPAGSDSLVFDIPIPNLRLWTLDDPFLYEVDVALDSVDEELDHLYSYFGMRKIGTAKLPGTDNNYITLNNKPVYLQMALDQSYHPRGYYTFPTDEFMREEIERAKSLGLNGLRIHIKTEIPRKLYWADRLGLLIMADIPNIEGDPDDDARRNWEYTAWRQIERDYNHPSIFSWVLFNETWGLGTENVNGVNVYLPKTREWVKSLYHTAKQLDPTRLIEDNSPCNYDHIITDINSWHAYLPAPRWASFLDDVVNNTYPGSEWNYIRGYKQTDIPMINSECGAVWGYLYGTGDIDLSYEYHIMINEFRRRPKIAGFIFTEFHDVINEWNGYYRYDRSTKDYGLGELCPEMTVKDFHSEMYLIPGQDFTQTYRLGERFSMPLTASFMTDNLPDSLMVRTLIHGWNSLGEHKMYGRGEFFINPRPFSVIDLPPLEMMAPLEESLIFFCTYLYDENGNIVNRNFVPFRVVESDIPQAITKIDSLETTVSPDSTTLTTKQRFIRVENPDDETTVLRQTPDSFSLAEWSVKQRTVMDSLKVWGTGTGFFEYRFPWPESIPADMAGEVRFIAEISARQIQGKDMSDGMVSSQSISNITRRGIDPGHSPNSYPMTDGIKHSSSVTITLNDTDPQTAVLEDDPADHRGVLSWLSQKPGSISWRLDEAGSYGYLVNVVFSAEAVEAAADAGEFRIRLAVEESSERSGGLAVYGKEFGHYPLDPTLLVRLK